MQQKPKTEQQKSSPTNLDEGSMGDETFGRLTSPKGARESHQRLFGKGAKVSPGEKPLPALTATPDEKAWNHRPRSESKDINLPARKKATAAKGLSPSKRK